MQPKNASVNGRRILQLYKILKNDKIHPFKNKKIRLNITKKDLRESVLKLLNNQKEEDRLRKSLSIKDKLFGTREFREAKTILFYASANGEVDTFEMIKQAKQLGKIIGLPKISRNHKEIIPTQVDSIDVLEKGPYDILEPKTGRTMLAKELDMVVVPGVAFDRHNNRLGRGGGYYDRFLSSLPQDVSTIGLAFDFQVVDILPSVAEHDVPVSRVICN